MKEGEEAKTSVLSDYVVVKALENGVTVIGLTRGQETKFAHTEKLDDGEVWIAQFTEHTSAIKVRGASEIHTKHGMLFSGRGRNEKG
ncbi:tryptophan RNA-binding attenuator protein [Aminomonas paucivorans DSM 12260]|uniref:Transcription attenuation protein MtrB n=1 Tax=Aminomonas paucivorans DSM 12260 TaxID=584708 RepID=E3CYR6_9BACT|nr:tryptophan RNA-binding attenuator protein [Aminomonas paucivorans DSM 12260]